MSLSNTTIKLNELKSVFFDSNEIKILKLNGEVIWKKATEKFVQSDLFLLPEATDKMTFLEILPFKNNVVVIRNNVLHYSEDFENWTTVMLAGTPDLVRICNNKLIYGVKDYAYYTDDLITFIELPKFTGVTKNSPFFDFFYDEKEGLYRFFEYSKRHDSPDLINWQSIPFVGKGVDGTSYTFYDGKQYINYRVSSNYEYASDNYYSYYTALDGTVDRVKRNFPSVPSVVTNNQNNEYAFTTWGGGKDFYYFQGSLSQEDKEFQHLRLSKNVKCILGVDGFFYCVHNSGVYKMKSNYSGYEEITVENFVATPVTTTTSYCEDKNNKCLYIMNSENTGVYKLQLQKEG